MAAPKGHCHLKRRRIEAVITGRTRNAFALRGTRVRIPPSPLASADLAEAFFCEFYKNSTQFIYKLFSL